MTESFLVLLLWPLFIRLGFEDDPKFMGFFLTFLLGLGFIPNPWWIGLWKAGECIITGLIKVIFEFFGKDLFGTLVVVVVVLDWLIRFEPFTIVGNDDDVVEVDLDVVVVVVVVVVDVVVLDVVLLVVVVVDVVVLRVVEEEGNLVVLCWTTLRLGLLLLSIVVGFENTFLLLLFLEPEHDGLILETTVGQSHTEK